MTKRAPPKKRVKGATGLASLTAAERARLVREIADELHDVRRSPAKTMSWFQSLRNPAKIVLASVIILAAMQLTAHGRDESRKIIAKMLTVLGFIPGAANGVLTIVTGGKNAIVYVGETTADIAHATVKTGKDLSDTVSTLAGRGPRNLVDMLMARIISQHPDEAAITLSKTPHVKARGHASAKSLATEWVPALVDSYNSYRKIRDTLHPTRHETFQAERKLLNIIDKFLEASLRLG